MLLEMKTTGIRFAMRQKPKPKTLWKKLFYTHCSLLCVMFNCAHAAPYILSITSNRIKIFVVRLFRFHFGQISKISLHDTPNHAYCSLIIDSIWLSSIHSWHSDIQDVMCGAWEMWIIAVCLLNVIWSPSLFLFSLQIR